VVVGLGESLIPCLVLGHRHAVLKDVGAQLPYLFRCALGEDTVVTVLGFVLVDAKGVFVGGVEGQQCFTTLSINAAGEPFAGFDDVVDGLEKLDEGGL
jgi:hypothetical protein